LRWGEEGESDLKFKVIMKYGGPLFRKVNSGLLACDLPIQHFLRLAYQLLFIERKAVIDQATDNVQVE
jgi:hypothetical protein